jgi:hypothetical protein
MTGAPASPAPAPHDCGSVHARPLVLLLHIGYRGISIRTSLARAVSKRSQRMGMSGV